MLGLTRRQKDCLEFIREYIAAHGASPSYEEIAAGIGLKSRGRVHTIVHDLVGRGHITIANNRARTIQVQSPLSFDVPANLTSAVRARAVQEGVSPVTVIRDAVRAYVSGAQA